MKRKELNVKKVKRMKRDRKDQIVEKMHEEKSSGWQSFISGGGKGKKKKGKKLKGMKKKSMFASPETVDGRVGVVNSDMKKTEFKDTRLKYQFIHTKK